MSLITCQNISLSYEKQPAVEQVSFHVEKGDFICIVGENGSGKSSLIRLLLGLIKPDQGSISFGEGLSQRDIGYLSQSSKISRDFPASVWEIVLSGTIDGKKYIPIYSSSDKKRVMKALDRFDIRDLKHQCYGNLSGGQQQRVLLARALCAARRVLILDEPVTGLDPVATGELYEIMKRLNKENDITILMVTHDIANSLQYASKILHMDRELAFFGTVDDYKKSSISKTLTGGVPLC